MTDPKYTDSELDHYREVFRSPGKGVTHVPVKDGQAGKVADMLDDLSDRRAREKGLTPCRVCREPAGGRYCPEHS